MEIHGGKDFFHAQDKGKTEKKEYWRVPRAASSPICSKVRLISTKLNDLANAKKIMQAIDLLNVLVLGIEPTKQCSENKLSKRY
jgi:hypothetical protein